MFPLQRMTPLQLIFLNFLATVVVVCPFEAWHRFYPSYSPRATRCWKARRKTYVMVFGVLVASTFVYGEMVLNISAAILILARLFSYET